ncbi:MAG: hypothetical protein ACRCZI_12965 [Cetobacterium sp.]
MSEIDATLIEYYKTLKQNVEANEPEKPHKRRRRNRIIIKSKPATKPEDANVVQSMPEKESKNKNSESTENEIFETEEAPENSQRSDNEIKNEEPEPEEVTKNEEKTPSDLNEQTEEKNNI